MLPSPNGQVTACDILDQLQHLAELKKTGAIDTEEFNMLKAMLIESSVPSSDIGKKDLD
jgi:hypothetical protein